MLKWNIFRMHSFFRNKFKTYLACNCAVKMAGNIFDRKYANAIFIDKFDFFRLCQRHSIHKPYNLKLDENIYVFVCVINSH